MSLMLCKCCDRLVDTDDDPEAWFDSPDAKEPNDYVLCAACRELREKGMEEDGN